MLGSIKVNYPNHPHIYVYDLGLSSFLKRDIRQKFENVTILDMPRFTPFWRSCYTWKTHILKSPLADANFYIDAGCQILRPLDGVFEKIEQNGYLLVSQGKEVLTRDIVPQEYADMLDFPNAKLDTEMVAAGLFGFKKNHAIEAVTEKVYAAALCGLCLGFSQGELWKNKGKNRTAFVRNCPKFRHDTTLLTMFVLKYIEHPIIESIENFEGNKTGKPEQLIWNIRMNYSNLEHLDAVSLSFPTKIFLKTFILAKKINLRLKGIKQI